jgi:hypothetical protein
MHACTNACDFAYGNLQICMRTRHNKNTLRHERPKSAQIRKFTIKHAQCCMRSLVSNSCIATLNALTHMLVSGMAGLHGLMGIPGAQGPPGPAGISGADGRDGVYGPVGRTGRPGESHSREPRAWRRASARIIRSEVTPACMHAQQCTYRMRKLIFSGCAAPVPSVVMHGQIVLTHFSL